MIKKISFMNHDIKLAGIINFPSDFDGEKRYPALVITHPDGSVKEQTAGIYAQMLAGKGYVTLVFDASYNGESTGTPHSYIDPAIRVEDISCAVDYLTTLPYVDRGRIGGVGICAGGGYMIAAAQTEKRLKAIGTVVAVDLGLGLRGDDKEARIKLLEEVGEERTKIANGAKPSYYDNIAPSDEAATQYPEFSLFRESRYYYTQYAPNPRAGIKIPVISRGKILGFTAMALIPDLLSQPLLMISGSKADTLGMSQYAVQLSGEFGELYVVNGATHIDLYYKENYMQEAVDKLAEFYERNL